MFIKRFLSAVVLIGLTVLIVIPGGYPLAAVLAVLSIIAYRELLNALGIGLKNPIEIIGYIDIIIYYLVLVFSKGGVANAVTIFTALISFMSLYVYTYPKYEIKDIMKGFFAIAYGPMMMGYIYLTRDLPHGQYYFWLILICSSLSDTFAYLFGMWLGKSGKHKLAPNLSPKKSVEGAVAGVLGTIISAAIYGYFVGGWVDNANCVWIFAIIGGIGSVISQTGDLAASGIKRNTGIKDYGKLIPGHGGIMDRFDSIIFIAPMIYLLCYVYTKYMM